MLAESITKRFFFYSFIMTMLLGIVLTYLYFAGATYFPTGNMAIFYHLLIHHDYFAFILFIIIFTATLLMHKNNTLNSLANIGTIHFMAYHPVKLSIILFIILSLCTLIIYHNHPLAMDEYIALFQAKVFAAGKLTGKWPPELLQHLVYGGTKSKFLLINPENGLVISKYWPGFSLLLTPFVLLGVPWALNPLLCASSLLLLYYIAQKLFIDKAEARGWIILFAVASPQFIVNGISYYSMPAHLFFNLAYTALLISPTSKRMFLAGVMGACAIMLHNPFPHLLFAIPWILWIIITPAYRKYLYALIIGYLPLLIGIGALNIYSRNLIFSAFSKAGAKAAEMAAGSSVSSHNLLIDTIESIFRSVSKPRFGLVWVRFLCFIKLWFWVAPGLLVLAFIGGLKKWNCYPYNILASSFILTFLASLFFGGSQGHGWGYRYIHQGWMVLPILGTAAIFNTNIGMLTTTDFSNLRRTLYCLCLLSLVLCNGLRMLQVYYHMDNHLKNLPNIDERRNQIVFVPSGFYTGDLIQNDPFLREPTIYLDNHGARNNIELIKKYFPQAKKESVYVWKVAKHPLELIKKNRKRPNEH